MHKSIRNKIIASILSALLLVNAAPGISFAWRGDSGYEGGISQTPMNVDSKSTYKYQEICFLSGKPVILNANLKISKTPPKDNKKNNTQTITTTYTYTADPANKNATLARTLVFDTTILINPNGQKSETTKLSKATETITINGTTYTCNNSPTKTNYLLTKPVLYDVKPAVNYFFGDGMETQKTYTVMSGSTTSTGTSDTITVSASGKNKGYEQYWSSVETQILHQTLTYCKAGGKPEQVGVADIQITATSTTTLKYYKNDDTPMSLLGGYVQTQYNENILKYSADLVELDKNKAATSKINKYIDSIKLESFRESTPLASPPLNKIRGHENEEAMLLMFGLGAYREPPTFYPEEYISRAEFIDAFVNVAKEVPIDPFFIKKITATKTKVVKEVSPFSDVSLNHPLYSSISSAAKRGIITGNKQSIFRPDTKVTKAEAVIMIINSLGLQDTAPNPTAVTSFRDNDTIASYARPAVYVAEKLNLIEADSKGNFNPSSWLTKAEAAELMKRYIDYMSQDMREDYMERLTNY